MSAGVNELRHWNCRQMSSLWLRYRSVSPESPPFLGAAQVCHFQRLANDQILTNEIMDLGKKRSSRVSRDVVSGHTLGSLNLLPSEIVLPRHSLADGMGAPRWCTVEMID